MTLRKFEITYVCGLYISIGQCCSKGSGMRAIFTEVTGRRGSSMPRTAVMVQSTQFGIIGAHVKHLCKPAEVI